MDLHEKHIVARFCEEDIIRMKKLIHKKKNGFWILLIVLGAVFWVTPFWSEDGAPPLIEKFSYFDALLKLLPFYLPATLVPFISYYLIIFRPVQTDLKKGIKITMQTSITVLRYLNPDFRLKVSNRRCKIYIKIEREDYKSLSVGDWIFISYVPKSRRAIEIRKIQ